MVHKTSVKTIAIINPVSGTGHFDSWHDIFVNEFLDHGFRVISISSCGHDSAKPAVPDLFVNGDAKLIRGRLLPARCRPKSSLAIRISKELRRFLRRLWGICTKMLMIKQVKNHASGEQATSGLNPLWLAISLGANIQAYGVRPDIVLIMYMDLLSSDRSDWLEYEAACDIPWAGIHFTAMSMREKPNAGFFELPMFRGLALMDAEATQRFREWFPNKEFVALPEVTNGELPERIPGWLQAIREKCGGRKLIVCAGSMSGRKNLGFLGQVVRCLSPDEWFVLVVGFPYKNTFNHQDLRFWEDATAGRIKNTTVVPRFIDEHSFNACLGISDIIFAAYRDFYDSSNMLIKAAMLERPLVATRGTYMGNQVEKYGLGTVVSSRHAEDAAEAIRLLLINPPSRDAFAAYRQANRADTIVARLEPLLQKMK